MREMRGPRRSGRGTTVARSAVVVLLLAATGCARHERPIVAGRRSWLLAVLVYADTARVARLSVPPPAARVWLARVTPARVALEVPAPLDLSSDSLPAPPDEGPALEVDPGLKPPVLRTPGHLVLPLGPHSTGWVDLDVRVDEDGAVSDALWVSGGTDTALVGAARHCALSMSFYPALRGGRPVPVWCRQRFDLRAPVPTERAGSPAGR